jgi:translation initiation factor IF-2
MKKFHFTHLFFYFLIAGLVQIPSMSWAQDMVTQPELELGSRPSFQKLEKNNPGQLKKRPRALQQRRDNRQERRQGVRENRRDNRQERRQDVRENRRDNRQERRQGVRENRRDNRQERRQDFRSKRQGGAQKSHGNKGSGGRGRR